MPCMKRVYRDKIGVGTLVSSQERRALAVPLINRLSTAGQPRVNHESTAGQPLISFLHRFTWDFVRSCFRRAVQDSVFDSLEGKKEGRFLAGSTRRRPVLPRLAPPSPPRRAPPRPDWPVVCSGFGFDRYLYALLRTCTELRTTAMRRTTTCLDLNLYYVLPRIIFKSS